MAQRLNTVRTRGRGRMHQALRWCLVHFVASYGTVVIAYWLWPYVYGGLYGDHDFHWMAAPLYVPMWLVVGAVLSIAVTFQTWWAADFTVGDMMMTGIYWGAYLGVAACVWWCSGRVPWFTPRDRDSWNDGDAPPQQ